MRSASQVLEAAPKPAFAALARRWARPDRFLGLGHDDKLVWGTFQSEEPWEVFVSLTDLSCRCDCPQPERPCAHALALALLLAQEPEQVPRGEPPAAATTWAGRKAKAKAPKAPDERRARAREQRVSAGLEQLRLWMCDQLRGGLASLESRPSQFWDGPAARLTDAQARGLADRVRRLGALPGAGEDWPERALLELGRLALICQAWERRELLDPGERRDLETVVGYTTRVDEVLASPGESDRWCVLGQALEELDHPPILTRRTWLLGQQTGRYALLLHFTPRGNPWAREAPPVGTQLRALLHRYPGRSGQRAELGERLDAPAPLLAAPTGAPSVPALLDQLADSTARQPWVEQHPALLLGATPAPGPERWCLHDHDGLRLPLVPGELWPLLAASAGRPLDIFGEWDGRALRPLGAWADGRFYALEA